MSDTLVKYFVSWVNAYADGNEDVAAEERLILLDLREAILKVDPGVMSCIVDDMIDCRDEAKIVQAGLSLKLVTPRVFDIKKLMPEFKYRVAGALDLAEVQEQDEMERYSPPIDSDEEFGKCYEQARLTFAIGTLQRFSRDDMIMRAIEIVAQNVVDEYLDTK